MKLNTAQLKELIRTELKEALQGDKLDKELLRLAGALPAGQQSKADKEAEQKRASSPEMQKKREEWASQIDPSLRNKPIGHLAVTGKTMEEGEEVSMEETLQEWEELEEATPPPVPGSSAAEKRARLDAVAAKVKSEREKAAAAKKANPAMKALDAVSHKITDRDNPESPFVSEKNKKVKLSQKELLEMIDETLKEIIQEKKKAGKLPAFLVKKSESKNKNIKKPTDKKPTK